MNSSSVEHFMRVANQTPHLHTWLSLLGDTFAAMQTHKVPSLEDILRFDTQRKLWLEDPPQKDTSNHEESDEYKEFMQQRADQYQRYLWSKRFPWEWDKGLPTPVCWNEGKLTYASYFTHRPILSILKQRLHTDPKKLPFATFPYRTLTHTEIARYELQEYAQDPWMIRVRDHEKKERIYCHWRYAKKNEKERTIIS